MNRDDLMVLSRERVRDARALLTVRRYAAAYYLCGYSIECAIKACIAAKTAKYDFPDKALATSAYSHDLVQLVKVAGLQSQLNAQVSKNPQFATNWAIAKDWAETRRYELTIGRPQARDLYTATTARQHGVLKWIKQFW
ncbi:hypothetical protein PXJ20_11980 [Paraburkholderia sp. A1RI_3L]|uniref:hypothetical protein n=1 Tax=Paraburkholderia TaxID=1822464 RepID=UPI003B7C3F5E